MKKLKHSKYKNAGILFELLARQITADILNDQEDSKANTILRTYFSESTELGKENKLYRIILEEKTKDASSADRLLEQIIRNRKKLNEKVLNLQKYNLIKEIRENYPLNDFLRGNINNYKLLASIFKVFEESVNSIDVDPREIFKARNYIIENIVASKNSSRIIGEDEKKDIIKIYQQQNEDVRLLAYKLLVDSFNDKYKKCLDDRQKILVREYINNISNTNSLRQYINNEVPSVRAEINALKAKIDNDVIRIKLDETINQLDKITKGTLVKDNQIVALLYSYELIKELKDLSLK